MYVSHMTTTMLKVKLLGAVVKFSRNGIPPPVPGVPPREIAVPPPKVVVPPRGNDVQSPFEENH